MGSRQGRINPLVPGDASLADQISGNSTGLKRQSVGGRSFSETSQGARADLPAGAPASPSLAKLSNATANPSHRRDVNRASWLYMDELAVSNVVTMVCFAAALMENLARINRGEWYCDLSRWHRALHRSSAKQRGRLKKRSFLEHCS